MIRNALIILFAVFIDVFQALLSIGFFIIGAFPGTVAGGVGGCVIGSYVGGKCMLGGIILGIVGTFGDPFVAPYSLPVAVGLGIAVNICIDVTLGTLLVMWLIQSGMYYPTYMISGVLSELIPGVNDLPGWTMLAVVSVLRKTAEEKIKGGLGSIVRGVINTGVASAGIFAAAGINKLREPLPQDEGEAQDMGEYMRTQSVEAAQLKNIDGIRASSPIPKTS